jgi:hypothetical protein
VAVEDRLQTLGQELSVASTPCLEDLVTGVAPPELARDRVSFGMRMVEKAQAVTVELDLVGAPVAPEVERD